jgi:hypothetical protein
MRPNLDLEWEAIILEANMGYIGLAVGLLFGIKLIFHGLF